MTATAVYCPPHMLSRAPPRLGLTRDRVRAMVRANLHSPPAGPFAAKFPILVVHNTVVSGNINVEMTLARMASVFPAVTKKNFTGNIVWLALGPTAALTALCSGQGSVVLIGARNREVACLAFHTMVERFRRHGYAETQVKFISIDNTVANADLQMSVMLEKVDGNMPGWSTTYDPDSFPGMVCTPTSQIQYRPSTFSFAPPPGGVGGTTTTTADPLVAFKIGTLMLFEKKAVSLGPVDMRPTQEYFVVVRNMIAQHQKPKVTGHGSGSGGGGGAAGGSGGGNNSQPARDRTVLSHEQKQPRTAEENALIRRRMRATKEAIQEFLNANRYRALDTEFQSQMDVLIKQVVADAVAKVNAQAEKARGRAKAYELQNKARLNALLAEGDLPFGVGAAVAMTTAAIPDITPSDELAARQWWEDVANGGGGGDGGDNNEDLVRYVAVGATGKKPAKKRVRFSAGGGDDDDDGLDDFDEFAAAFNDDGLGEEDDDYDEYSGSSDGGGDYVEIFARG